MSAPKTAATLRSKSNRHFPWSLVSLQWWFCNLREQYLVFIMHDMDSLKNTHFWLCSFVFILTLVETILSCLFTVGLLLHRSDNLADLYKTYLDRGYKCTTLWQALLVRGQSFPVKIFDITQRLPANWTGGHLGRRSLSPRVSSLRAPSFLAPTTSDRLLTGYFISFSWLASLPYANMLPYFVSCWHGAPVIRILCTSIKLLGECLVDVILS